MSVLKHSYTFRVLKSFKDRGFIKTCKLVWQERIHPVIHNLDVGGLVFPEELVATSKNKMHACRYEAVNISAFDHALSLLSIDSGDYTFVDLGCGKGLALFLANRKGFKHVVGVEFDSRLVNDCQKNLSGKISSDNFEVLNLDAMEYDPPCDNTVLFLNNPFNEEIIRGVFRRLLNSNMYTGKNNLIVYNNAMHKSALVDLGFEMIRFDEKDPLNVYSGGIAIFRFPGKEEK